MGTTRTTCPYCGVGCGVLATPQPDGSSPLPATRITREFRQALLERFRPRRDHGDGGSPALPGNPGTSRKLGRGFGAGGQPLRRDGARAWPGFGGALRLRPDPHRGLLRREQADEGLHRHREYRHEFAPLHGLLRAGHRGPSEPIPCRGSMPISPKPNSWCSWLELAWCHPVLFQRLLEARSSAPSASWWSIRAAR